MLPEQFLNRTIRSSARQGHLLGSSGFKMTGSRKEKERETGQTPAEMLVVKLTFPSEARDFLCPIVQHNTVLQRQKMPS